MSERILPQPRDEARPLPIILLPLPGAAEVPGPVAAYYPDFDSMMRATEAQEVSCE